MHMINLLHKNKVYDPLHRLTCERYAYYPNIYSRQKTIHYLQYNVKHDDTSHQDVPYDAQCQGDVRTPW